LKRVLALEPEHAHAHASLALCLLGARRRHAASTEAGLALGIDPDSAFCHYAAACACRANRKLDDAYKHCLVAINDDGHELDARVLAAAIKMLQEDNVAARALLMEALAIDATHTAALATLAKLELAVGNLGEAHRRIEEALTQDPADGFARVIAGHVALARGRVEDAEEHCRFVLANDAASHDALSLLTAIKARRNPFLGVWWRWSMFVGNRAESSKIAILLGSFVAVQLAIILLYETGYEEAEMIVAQIWLAFCAYTWFAPSIFRWMLKREMKTVALRDDY
jgi:tetratricopeptide (TPR) repeat protein